MCFLKVVKKDNFSRLVVNQNGIIEDFSKCFILEQQGFDRLLGIAKLNIKNYMAYFDQ